MTSPLMQCALGVGAAQLLASLLIFSFSNIPFSPCVYVSVRLEKVEAQK